MVQSAMLANMVQETVSVGGTGNITLGGASAGFNSFSDYFADGPGISYWIADGNDWETGIGHLTTTQTVLVRDDILRRSVAGVVTDLPAAMNVSTSATVSVRPSALMQPASFLTFNSGVGQYDAPDNIKVLDQSFLMTANRLYLVSSYFLFPRKIAQIGVDVNVASGGGTNARCGYYTANPDGSPGTLIMDSGNIDITTVGIKMVPAASWVAGGPNPILLPAGHYYSAWVTDSTTAKVWGTGSISISWGGFLSEFDSQRRRGAFPYQDNITGALPASITVTNDTNNAPVAIFRPV